ncbi:FAS1-like dehydratase domain-containing protein [Rhodoligotrophos defluvii]|uniref:FAS1-like dehydratase domain-containing protein n=1 Tax=Rhodoligotrophos defluvii TaxID=2561934 RepID=UPI0010C9498B|nr:MaoC family dehydratase N-terminal domain-containing protein [Rhodoligotrophos defluvii]
MAAAVESEKPFAEWIGRTTEAEDVVAPRLVASFRATFEPFLAPTTTDEAPLGIHWCLSPAIAPQSALGPDGHPAKNRDVPPVPQPRRMWAGGSVEIFDPLRVGDRVKRVTTIANITRKQGRSGELWFVAVDHVYSTGRGVALRERHDMVYREAAKPGTSTGPTAADDAAARPHSRTWTVETPPTFLFRYSAITFNGHRIHYDYPYATEVEGYAGLVVHGPIQATLLLNLAASEEGRAPERFSYRGLSPAFGGDPLLVCAGTNGEAGVYWTQHVSGRVHMEGRSSLR